MKKIVSLFGYLFLLCCLAGCNESLLTIEDTPAFTDVVKIRIRVSNPLTRAVINDLGYGPASFSWEYGDDIGVVVDGHFYRFVLIGKEDDNTGSFVADLPTGSSIIDGAQIAYPYNSSDYDESTGSFNITYPTEYSSSKDGEFRHRWAGVLRKGGQNIFYADLSHQTAILRVTYDGVPTEAKSVQLTADLIIAGESKTVTNHFSWHDDLMNFYFPIPEGIYHSFTISLLDENGVIERTRKQLSGNNMVLEVGKIYRTPPISLYTKNFSVDLQVVTDGFDGTQSWFQPRIAWTGNPGEYSLIMQPWFISISDYFGTYHEMHTYDGGLTWSTPVSLDDVLGDKYSGDLLLRIADVNSQYHSKTNKILAIGGICEYLDGVQQGMVRQTGYFTYSPDTHSYSPYKILTMPEDPLFSRSYPGCSQWVELTNGDILQPFRMWDEDTGQFSCTVARCSFDGVDMTFNEFGNVMRLNRGRGLYEPSLIEWKGRYYLTLRNDVNGLVSVSDDGLHYSEPIEWRFDDNELINSENTQQHWVKSPWGLYLVYTSANRPESENVMRGRAPLFIARFDEEKMCLLKETERILVPNTGAQLGNFGAFDLDRTHSWIVTSEATTPDTQLQGDNNARVYIAKIKWY